MTRKGLFKVLTVVIVVFIVLTVSVGAIWTKDLVLQGSASSGKMDVQFVDKTLTPHGVGVYAFYTPSTPYTLNFKLGNLYPDTAHNVYVELYAKVQNKGSIPVKFNTATITSTNPLLTDNLQVYDVTPSNNPAVVRPFMSWPVALNNSVYLDTAIFNPAGIWGVPPGQTCDFKAKIKMDDNAPDISQGQLSNIELTLNWKTP